ncbi:hypothetical protein BDR03DRAFT_744570 [Suillus americanus]|nr:hypothetical protein BDR03DRAFT_744570 [Suillus americanus]
MWDDGVVVPHPPIRRSLEITKAALEKAGYKGFSRVTPLPNYAHLAVVVDWKPIKHRVRVWRTMFSVQFPAYHNQTHIFSFGALFSSYFASRFGRKPGLLASGVIYLIGSIIQSTAGNGTSPAVGLKVLYFSRFFGGVGVGLMSALVPTYVSECAPRAIRGRCTGSIEVAVQLENMLAFWVNYSVSLNILPGQMQWRLTIIAQIVPGALLLFMRTFIMYLAVFFAASPPNIEAQGGSSFDSGEYLHQPRRDQHDGICIFTTN